MVFIVQSKIRGWRNPRSISKKGRREDLGGVYFRSAVEANIARYFNFVGVKWEYEPKEFVFPIRRGIRSFRPDFYLPEEDRWVEVKGWLDRESMTRLRRFKKYYPEEFKKMVVYAQAPSKKAISELLRMGCDFVSYDIIEKLFGSLIREWE